MSARNICKFIPETSRNVLEMRNFIYETDSRVMGNNISLTTNRALLVIGGEGKITLGAQMLSVSMGTLLFCFSGESFCASGSSDFEYMYISFDGARSDELFRRFGITGISRSYDGFEGLIPLWRDSLARASEENIDLLSESMLLYALSRLRTDLSEKNGIVNKIVVLSEERFTDHELSISSVAKELGYNAKYVSHIFKEKMGIGYSEYLRNLRIKYAVSLFDHGLDSVKNVALLSGFTDPLYFSTVFKNTVGISPKEYKKS